MANGNKNQPGDFWGAKGQRLMMPKMCLPSGLPITPSQRSYREQDVVAPSVYTCTQKLLAPLYHCCFPMRPLLAAPHCPHGPTIASQASKIKFKIQSIVSEESRSSLAHRKVGKIKSGAVKKAQWVKALAKQAKQPPP